MTLTILYHYQWSHFAASTYLHFNPINQSMNFQPSFRIDKKSSDKNKKTVNVGPTVHAT